jgi:hypothetical protein
MCSSTDFLFGFAIWWLTSLGIRVLSVSLNMNDLPILTMQETIDELRRLTEHLELLTRQAAEDDVENLEASIELLVALNSVKSNLNSAYASYEQTVAAGMEETYQLTLPGNIVVTRRQGGSRKKWDSKRLGKEVAHRIVDQSIDMDTGEILYSTEEMIAQLLQYAAPSYWRVTELKKIGIDANNYSTVEDGKISVVIERKQP